MQKKCRKSGTCGPSGTDHTYTHGKVVSKRHLSLSTVCWLSLSTVWWLSLSTVWWLELVVEVGSINVHLLKRYKQQERKTVLHRNPKDFIKKRLVVILECIVIIYAVVASFYY